MQREITYDAVEDRLAFVARAADQVYWDGQWKQTLTHADIARGDRFVVAETKRVLSTGARVVDAGCGIGATVYGLAQAGFDARGIDYAEATVAAIQALFPRLKVEVADVRAMPFADASLDGVWSLGVIEHFFDGYAAVINETRRVLRPGGYLFLTVPVISSLKALKIRLGHYRSFEPADRGNFFQFAFRQQTVVDVVTSHSFRMLRSCGRSGSFGLSEDLGRAAKLLLPLNTNSAILARAWWRAVDKVVTPFSHHTRYFLFQKIG